MEKLPIHTGDAEGSDPKNPSDSRRDRSIPPHRIVIAVSFLICWYLFIKLAPTTEISHGCMKHHAPGSTGSEIPQSWAPDTPDQTWEEYNKQPQTDLADTRIPLEAHIMSKCPDAQVCLQKLVLPAMEQISDKVDFKLSFIASVTNDSSEIKCMHGPAECIGDMLILCAANLPFPPTDDEALLPQSYPRTPIIRSLGFANCLINEYQRIPEREFVHQCALEYGIDFESLNQCASQQNDDPDHGDNGDPPLSGIALLRKSALHSSSVDAETSCTVRLDDKTWCIHDSGAWKDCTQDGSDPRVLADEVKRLYAERN
ncbi:hypothetical protein N7523_006841 [Penicillium sp. IBT 18751x]|nr:hypothetical protein N7523_006841 [Penicillium sp. IBT 18751x]